jgi:hypothetical protein
VFKGDVVRGTRNGLHQKPALTKPKQLESLNICQN